jgi:hypothetical protein
MNANQVRLEGFWCQNSAIEARMAAAFAKPQDKSK